MGKSILSVSMIVVISLVFTSSCVSKEVPVKEMYYDTQYRTEYKTESYSEIGQEHREYLTPKRGWNHWMYFKELEWAKEMASYYSGFEISTAGRLKSQIRLILTSEPVPWAIAVYDLTGVGQIPSPPPRGEFDGRTIVMKGESEYIPTPVEQEWLDNFNTITTDPKHLLSFTMSDQHTGRDIIVNVIGVEEFALITNAPWMALPYGAQISPAIERVQLIWFDEITKERQVPHQVPYEVEKQRTVMQTKKVPIWEVWKAKPPAEK